MNAFTNKDELALLPATRNGYVSPYNAERASRPTLIERITAWFERQSTLAELRKLTDRELADIGLQRSELSRVFEAGFSARR
jgi:uncharacterized protein YjiS (DUF1127 family)